MVSRTQPSPARLELRPRGDVTPATPTVPSPAPVPAPAGAGVDDTFAELNKHVSASTLPLRGLAHPRSPPCQPAAAQHSMAAPQQPTGCVSRLQHPTTTTSSSGSSSSNDGCPTC